VSEQSADKDAGLWVVSELSLSLAEPPPEGEPHPETTPVGPFESREAADAWAFAYVGKYRSGSWSIAPLRSPESSGGEVAPGSADDAGIRAHVQTPRRSQTRDLPPGGPDA
jgi:hypothetical protein